jgi:hypothetical protein
MQKAIDLCRGVPTLLLVVTQEGLNAARANTLQRVMNEPAARSCKNIRRKAHGSH